MLTTEVSQKNLGYSSKFPSDRVVFVDLKKENLKYLDHLTYTLDMNGNVHYCARVVPRGLHKESHGDFDAREVKARAELGRFMKRQGFDFWLDRDTPLVAAHNTEDPTTSFLGKLEASLLFGTFRRKERSPNLDEEKFPKAKEKTVPYQLVPESHKKHIELYYQEIGQELSELEMSSKGTGITNRCFLCPAFKIGEITHNGQVTTWQDFSAMLVTGSAAFADEYPDVEIFTRASLMKDTLMGLKDAPSPIEWFGLSCQVKVKGFKDIETYKDDPVKLKKLKQELRDKIAKLQTSRRKRNSDGTLEPFRDDMVDIRKIQNPVLEQKRFEYDTCRNSPPNPDSGYLLARIIAPGEECGMVGDKKVMHVHLQLKRLLELALDQLERYGEDLTLTEEEKRKSLDSQTEFATMTIARYEGHTAYTGRSFSGSQRFTYIINSPAKQKSEEWRLRKTYHLSDGTEVIRYKDPEHKRWMYREPYAASKDHANRDKFDRAVSRGVESVHGYMSKILVSEPPNDMEMTPAMAENLHTIRYANFMDKDFVRSGYFVDSVTADIQSFGFDKHGFKRLMIFHTGKSKEVTSGKRHASGIIKGYVEQVYLQGQKVQRYVEEFFSGTNLDTAKRSTGFGKMSQIFSIVREKTGLFPWYDKTSPFAIFMESKFFDQQEASEVVWVDEVLEWQRDGGISAGYLKYMQYAGIDLELPLQCYLQHFEAGVTNLYEIILKDCQKLVPKELWHLIEVDIHQTDGIRKWDEFYDRIRFSDDLVNHLAKLSGEFFVEVANEHLKGERKGNVTFPLDFKIEHSIADCYKIFRHGNDDPKLLKSYFESAKRDYVKHLARDGVDPKDIKDIEERITHQYKFFEEKLHEARLDGGKADPLIRRSHNSAITFLIGMNARVKVKWPKDPNYRPDEGTGKRPDEAELVLPSRGSYENKRVITKNSVLSENSSEIQEIVNSALQESVTSVSEVIYHQVIVSLFDALRNSQNFSDLQRELSPLFNRLRSLQQITPFAHEIESLMSCGDEAITRIEEASLKPPTAVRQRDYDGDLAKEATSYLLHALWRNEPSKKGLRLAILRADDEVKPITTKNAGIKRFLEGVQTVDAYTNSFKEDLLDGCLDQAHRSLVNSANLDSDEKNKLKNNLSSAINALMKRTLH